MGYRIINSISFKEDENVVIINTYANIRDEVYFEVIKIKGDGKGVQRRRYDVLNIPKKYIIKVFNEDNSIKCYNR